MRLLVLLRSVTTPTTQALTTATTSSTASRVASQRYAVSRASRRAVSQLLDEIDANGGGIKAVIVSPTSLKSPPLLLPITAAVFVAPANNHSLSWRRLFHSSTMNADPAHGATIILPVMMTPSSNLSAARILLPPSTIESLQSLPECQSVFNILYGTASSSSSDGRNNPAATTHSLPGLLDNLHRSRDILHAFPELEAATYLLEVELLTYYGEFQLAIDCLARYEHLHKKIIKKDLPTRKKRKHVSKHEDTRKLQFFKAKLFYVSGKFTRALAEYEDILESMEQEVEAQVQRMDFRQDSNNEEHKHPDKNKNHIVQKDDSVTTPLPVIHGAAALSAVGITKLLIHLRKGQNYCPSTEYSNKSDIEDIIEAMETAADMLLESRKDALLSHEHANLAIDLGLAASIALTNLGVAHCLLLEDTSKALEVWKKGLTTVDDILQDAMNSLTVIPKHKFMCMESVRARLYCNIAWIKLGNPAWERGMGGFIGPDAKVPDSTLKDASEAARKALNIYDELMNGPKVTRDGGIIDDGGDDDPVGDDVTIGTMEEEKNNTIIGQELDQMLMEHETDHPEEEDEESNDPTANKPPDLPISPQWFHHHHSESAWALSLVAQCYALAGAAVTAEGIFRSAMDASSSYPLGQNLKSNNDPPGRRISTKGVSLSSPNLGLIARDVRVWYAYLCDMETKRKSDGDKLRSDAWMIEDDGVLRGYVRDEEGAGTKQRVSGLESSLWLFGPSDLDL